MGCAFFSAYTLSAQIVDNFSVSHDYTGGNVAGTIWTGAYAVTGDTNGTTVTSSTNINSTFNTTANPGQLTITDVGGHFEGNQNTAHLLYMSVTGDFTATVNLVSNTTLNYSCAGLMAADPTLLTGVNVPANANYFWLGEQQANHNYVRSVVGGSQSDQNPSGSVAPGASNYLEITRVGSVFTAYLSSDGGSTYTQFGNSVTRADLPATLDVGLAEGGYNDGNLNPGTAVFDNFSLTTVPEPSAYAMLLGGLGLLIVLRRFSARKA